MVRRNPFQVFLLTASLVAAGPLILGRPGPEVLTATLPRVAVTGWGVALLTGSTLALFGVLVSHRSWYGLVLERSGLLGVGGAALIYFGVLLTAGHDLTAIRYTASIHAGYAAACLWRAGQVTVTMRAHRSAKAGR